MVSTYYLAFRISNVDEYEKRYQSLIACIENATAGKWWLEPASFIVFSSELNIEALVQDISTVLDLDRDIAVLGKTEFRTMRIIGASSDEDIFDLVPFAEKVAT